MATKSPNRGQPYWMASVTTLIITVNLCGISRVVSLYKRIRFYPLYSNLVLSFPIFSIFLYSIVMGCGLSTRLNPEDSASVSHGRMSDVHVTDVNSPATGKNLDRDGGGDSVQRSQKDEEGEKEDEEGEKEDEDDHSEELIFPRSPSFREYCIASSRPRNQSFSDNDSAFSIKNSGDEDSINKPEDLNKERKKKERRIVGLRNVKGMFIRKRNVVNFSRHTSHIS